MIEGVTNNVSSLIGRGGRSTETIGSCGLVPGDGSWSPPYPDLWPCRWRAVICHWSNRLDEWYYIHWNASSAALLHYTLPTPPSSFTIIPSFITPSLHLSVLPLCSNSPVTTYITPSLRHSLPPSHPPPTVPFTTHSLLSSILVCLSLLFKPTNDRPFATCARLYICTWSISVSLWGWTSHFEFCLTPSWIVGEKEPRYSCQLTT